MKYIAKLKNLTNTIVLSLPCALFIAPIVAKAMEESESNENTHLSLPTMRTQSQYMSALKSSQVKIPNASPTSDSEQKVTDTQKNTQVYIVSSENETTQKDTTPILLKNNNLIKKNENNSASKKNVNNNNVVLKKNYDFFPKITQDYEPFPAYAKVRWQGEKQKSIEKNKPIDYLNGNTNVNSISREYLRKMVSRALAYSPEIRAATADVLASEYNVDQAKGQRWPQVRLGASSPFSTIGGDKRTSRNNSKISDSSGSVSVTTPIIDWGKISNQVDSAKETANAARYSEDYSREQLAYNTISELINLDRYLHSRIVAKAYVDRMKKLANMLEQITQSDHGRDSEWVQAKAKLMSAQASLDNINHEVSTSRIKLVRLLGQEPKMPQKVSWCDTLMPASVAIAALDKNPMLLNLQAKVRASEYDAENIKSSSMPQVNWIISKNTAKDTNGDETGWYTGLNVEWDLFSGGSQRAAQMSARAKANAAQQQYEVSYRDLEYQINNQIQIRDSSFLRADDYDRLSSETDRVRVMFYDQWYHLGKRTLLDVLTAENDHFNNQLSTINNRYDGYISNMNVVASSAMLLSWLGISTDTNSTH